MLLGAFWGRLEIKSRWDIKNSENLLSNEHKNFIILLRNGWENKVKDTKYLKGIFYQMDHIWWAPNRPKNSPGLKMKLQWTHTLFHSWPPLTCHQTLGLGQARGEPGPGPELAAVNIRNTVIFTRLGSRVFRKRLKAKDINGQPPKPSGKGLSLFVGHL